VHEPLELGDRAFDEREEEAVVDRVFADHLATVAAIDNVVECSFEVGTRRSRHAADRSGAVGVCKEALRS
jgi:hypothetical protein